MRRGKGKGGQERVRAKSAPRRQRCPLSQAMIAELYTTTSGGTPRSRICVTAPVKEAKCNPSPKSLGTLIPQPHIILAILIELKTPQIEKACL